MRRLPEVDHHIFVFSGHSTKESGHHTTFKSGQPLLPGAGWVKLYHPQTLGLCWPFLGVRGLQNRRATKNILEAAEKASLWLWIHRGGVSGVVRHLDTNWGLITPGKVPHWLLRFKSWQDLLIYLKVQFFKLAQTYFWITMENTSVCSLKSPGFHTVVLKLKPCRCKKQMFKECFLEKSEVTWPLERKVAVNCPEIF